MIVFCLMFCFPSPPTPSLRVFLPTLPPPCLHPLPSLCLCTSFPASPRLSPLSISPIRLSLATLAPTPQAEAGRVELELSMTKLRVEEASLRDSLSKLSALNESLAQDKLGLNRLVAQVCCVLALRSPTH